MSPSIPLQSGRCSRWSKRFPGTMRRAISCGTETAFMAHTSSNVAVMSNSEVMDACWLSAVVADGLRSPGQGRRGPRLGAGLVFVHDQLGGLARLGRLAGEGGLHDPEELDHGTGGHIPIFGLLDMHLQESQVRVIKPVGKPGAEPGTPELG